jgi:hypothetical protein
MSSERSETPKTAIVGSGGVVAWDLEHNIEDEQRPELLPIPTKPITIPI